MTRPVADYIALALIGNLEDPNDTSIFSPNTKSEFKGSWSELKAEAESRCGFDVSEAVLRDAVRTLSKAGLVRVSNDKFAGEFVKTYPERFASFVERAKSEDSQAVEDADEFGPIKRPSDYPNANALITHPVLDDYSELGDEWLRRAISGLKQQVSENGDLANVTVEADDNEAPASDRIVTLGHNQITKIEDEADNLLQVLDEEWSEPNEPDDTSLAVGKIKAGLELVRAAIFELELFKMSMIAGLNLLVEKYKGHAISAAASSLLNLILKELGLA